MVLSKEDRVILNGLRCKSNIGVTFSERNSKQPLLIDVEAFIDLKKGANSEKLEHTPDYRKIVESVRGIAEKNEFVLLEALALEIIGKIKKDFNATKVVIRIGKEKVANRYRADFLGVELVG